MDKLGFKQPLKIKSRSIADNKRKGLGIVIKKRWVLVAGLKIREGL